MFNKMGMIGQEEHMDVSSTMHGDEYVRGCNYLQLRCKVQLFEIDNLDIMIGPLSFEHRHCIAFVVNLSIRDSIRTRMRSVISSHE